MCQTAQNKANTDIVLTELKPANSGQDKSVCNPPRRAEHNTEF